MTTPPISPQDIRAAAEVHRELGPEYSDAVVQSFFEKVDKEIQARIDSHMASAMRTRRPRLRRMSREQARGVMKGIAIGGLGAGIPFTVVGWWFADRPWATTPFAEVAIVIWALALVGFLALCIGLVARKPADRDG
jgi:hypothetical protein